MLVFSGFNLIYHAKDNTATDNPINQGLAGAIHDIFAAILLLPASKAITGVMQQSEAATADRTPAPINAPEDFVTLIQFPVFEFACQYA